MDNSTIAIIVSLIALLVSGVTFWFSHLRPFKLNISYDPPRLSLYTITPQMSGSEKGETWWIPSFDIGLTLTNTGKRHGDINDIRIVASIKSHRSEKKLYFYPKWLVDYSVFNQCHTDRFEWIHKAIVRDWYPLRLGSEQDVTFHLILEGDRMDHREPGELIFELQIATSESYGWKHLEEFKLYITEDDFDSKSAYSPMSKKIEKLRGVA